MFFNVSQRLVVTQFYHFFFKSLAFAQFLSYLHVSYMKKNNLIPYLQFATNRTSISQKRPLELVENGSLIRDTLYIPLSDKLYPTHQVEVSRQKLCACRDKLYPTHQVEVRDQKLCACTDKLYPTHQVKVRHQKLCACTDPRFSVGHPGGQLFGEM